MSLLRSLLALAAGFLATDELRSAEGRTGPSDDRPLTDQEIQMVRRLLSDPFSFPIQYKSWLVSYLESSDMNLPISAVNGLTDILGVAGIGGGTLGILPAGIVLPFGALAAPAGSLLCDGASYLKTDYDRLWQAIGATYGSVDSTHFSVPDLRGRVAVGKGTHATVGALGNNDGQAVGVRRPQHGHTVRDPTHVHGSQTSGWDFLIGQSGGGAGAPSGGRNVNWASTTAGAATGVAVGQAADPAIDAPPYLTLNFIIIA